MELNKALVAAQLEVQAVEKTAKNQFHGYKYASAETLIAEGRGALNNAGLALSVLDCQFEWNPGPDLPGGAIGRVHVTYQLRHTSGEHISWKSSSPVVPEKGRPADKAEFAARTENLGYTIRDLLLIPRVAEDVSGRDDRPQKSSKTEKLDALCKRIDEASDDFQLSTILPDINSCTDAEKEVLRPRYKAKKATFG